MNVFKTKKLQFTHIKNHSDDSSRLKYTIRMYCQLFVNKMKLISVDINLFVF